VAGTFPGKVPATFFRAFARCYPDYLGNRQVRRRDRPGSLPAAFAPGDGQL